MEYVATLLYCVATLLYLMKYSATLLFSVEYTEMFVNYAATVLYFLSQQALLWGNNYVGGWGPLGQWKKAGRGR